MATSEVRIGSTVCEVVSWTDTHITVIAPAITGGGFIGVYKQGCPSNGTWVQRSNINPTVTSLSDAWANPGEQVTIYGHGFGALQGSGFAAFNGTRAEIVSWSDTAVTAVVPDGATVGYAGIFQNGESSNGAYFVPFEPPVISALSTSSAFEGERVTITGTSFGADPGTLTVGGVVVPTISWSDTTIEFDVPIGLASGYVGVGKSGATSNGKWLTVSQ